MDKLIFSFYFSCLIDKKGSEKGTELAVDELRTIFANPGDSCSLPRPPTAFPQTCSTRSLKSALENLQQHVQIVIEFVFLGPQRVDGLDRMNHGGVVAAAKGIADFGKAVRGHFAA